MGKQLPRHAKLGTALTILAYDPGGFPSLSILEALTSLHQQLQLDMTLWHAENVARCMQLDKHC